MGRNVLVAGGSRAGWFGALVLAVLGLVTCLAAPVWAAPEARGFGVSPAFREVDVKGDQDRVQFELQIRNHNAGDQNFRLSVVDFGSLDEQGGVAFLGAPASELEHKYGLASWMTLEKDAVFVPAGQSVPVTITVDNRPSLAPGGHYGAVLVTAVTETGEPVKDPSVGVKQVLSSLVLATKEGGVERNLKLVEQTSNGGWGRLPSQMEYRFANAGNVHGVPRGVTEVRDPGGRVVARGALNEESASILPETFRKYKAPVLGVATAWMPGRYVVATSYRYDGEDATRTLTTGFWYAGMLVVWLVGVVVLAAAGVLVWWWCWRPRWGLRAKR